MSLALIMVCAVTSAQQLKASGSIVDGTGLEVIGATVMEKGTNNATVTDIDGNFKLEVTKGATLVISYVGYRTMEFPAAVAMKIILKEDANDLNEVVVTGYTAPVKSALRWVV